MNNTDIPIMEPHQNLISIRNDEGKITHIQSSVQMIVEKGYAFQKKQVDTPIENNQVLIRFWFDKDENYSESLFQEFVQIDASSFDVNDGVLSVEVTVEVLVGGRVSGKVTTSLSEDADIPVV